MRPVYLSVEGLACFKEKQEIDFSELDLFAISGPTGAGKSTLLDAMLFALYGMVPRVGKQDLKEMISAARDRVSVRFDFDVGDRRLRITRSLRRKGAATVRLEEHDGNGFNENLADQVRTADDAIAGILGLDGDAFTQAVVLPQGQFARFLQANPRDRRSMLRTLLRLDVYERMREDAQRQSSERKSTRDSVHKLLEDEYEGVTDSALAALQSEEKQIAKQLKRLRKDRDAVQDELARIRTLHAKTEELAQKEGRLAELNMATADIDAMRSELQAGERAVSLAGVLDEATRAAKEAKRAGADADKATADKNAAAELHDEKSKLLQEASKAAAEVAPLRDKVTKLNQILGRLPERDRTAAGLARQLADVEANRKKVDRLSKELKTLEKTQLKGDTEVDAARKALEAVRYDADLHAGLESVRDLATKLSVSREGLKAAQEEQTKRQKDWTAFAGRIQKLKRDATRVSQVEADAQKALAIATEALHAAHHKDEANHLRQSLTPGQPCPVCEQVVAAPPPANLHPDVANATADLEIIGLRFKEAERVARAKHHVLTQEQARAEAARRAYEEAEAAHNKAIASVAQQETGIRSRLGSRDPKDQLVIELWVGEQVRSSMATRQAHDEAKRSLADAELALARNAEAQERAKESLDESDTTLARLTTEMKESESQLSDLQKTIEKVTTAVDPLVERDQLVIRIEGLESSQATASAATAESKAMLTAAEQAVKLTTKAAEAAEKEALQRVRSREDRIGEAGFQDVNAVNAAVRSIDILTGLRGRIQAHERELHSVEERISALKQELGKERASTDELDTAISRASELTADVEKLVGRSQKLEQQIESMRKRIDRSKELRKELEAAERAFRLYNHLANDLRSDKFQAYVLEETFTELVRGASARLLGLTGDRYSLQFSQDQIFVVDHDNADETRISDTLSGGETFLTSLALALELSDQVQRAAGAVNLDSLFIDEGFGTLDPDTLAVVSETIQSLQVGGRMVGIITHIPELRDEFSQQILVTKHHGHSTLAVRLGAA